MLFFFTWTFLFFCIFKYLFFVFFLIFFYQSAKRKQFQECQELIVKIKAGEIIASSTEPKTAAEVEEIVETEEAKRKTIRESRLKRFEDLATTDHTHQKMSIELMQTLNEHCKESTEFKREALDVLKRMAASMEQSNAYYVLWDFLLYFVLE